MKEYFTNTYALTVILFTLLGLSIFEVFIRLTVFHDTVKLVSNYGEPFVSVVFAILLIFFLLTNKRRIFFILCGGWLAYFSLNQLFVLPSVITDLFTLFGQTSYLVPTTSIIILHIVSIVTIIILGGILVEYMNDGTIYDRAFNIVSLITIMIIVAQAVISMFMIVTHSYYVGISENFLILSFLNCINRVVMVFLFAYFAYGTLKAELIGIQQ